MQRLNLGSPNRSSSHLPPAPARPRRTRAEAIAIVEQAMAGNYSAPARGGDYRAVQTAVADDGSLVVRTANRTITFAPSMSARDRDAVLSIRNRRRRDADLEDIEVSTVPGTGVTPWR